MNSIAIALHAIAATVWVGGMFFMVVVLRPSVQTIDAPQRLPIMAVTLRKFFPWVWMAIVILFGTGYWLVMALGGFSVVVTYVHIMHLLFWLMAALFAFMYFVPNKAFRTAVEQGNNEVAAQALARIRIIVTINLVLGIALIAIVTGGRYA